MNLRKTVTLLAVATALASAQFVPQASAATGSLNSILITADGGPLASQAGAAQLLAKAGTSGSVAVIAQLGVPLSDQASVSATQAAQEAAALDRAQDGVVARVLGGAVSGANVKRFDIVPAVALTVNAAQLQKLLSDPAVTGIQEDLPVPPTLQQSVPLIRATNIHALGFTGANQIVAILDTGVQKTHAMISAAKVISEACFSTTGSGGTSVCPAGSHTAPGSGVNCSLAIAGCDHGTHVASIAAGRIVGLSGGGSIRGVAPSAQLIAVQVFSRFTGANCSPGPSPCALSFTSDQILGLQRVFALRASFGSKRIDSVNMSLGGGSFAAPCVGDSRQPVITALRNAGIAVAIASGNSFFDGSIGAPACVPGAIVVGSSLKADNGINGFSNHSPFVHLLAPGDNILAAQASSTGTALGTKSGTSMATPHVAGAWALMRQMKPGASISRVLTALNCTGKLLGRANLFRPRIDLLLARSEELAADPSQSFPFTSSAAGWASYLRPWSRVGGELVSLNISNWALAVHNYCSPSFRVVAQMRRFNPSPSTFNSGIVIASQAVTSGANKLVSGYFFAFNKGAGVGNVQVFRLNNFNFATNAGSAALLCNGNKPTGAGSAYHTIRVDVTNQVFRYFLDGVAICTVTDFSYPPARILTAAAGGGAGHNLRVNSVTITPIATASVSSVDGMTATEQDFGPHVRVAQDTGASPSGL